jgi:hypothetical protein
MPKLRKALKDAERLDVEAALRLGEWRDNPVVKALAGLAGIADQPPAVTAGALLLAVALLRRDARLGEAAIRLVAAILVTTMLKTGVERVPGRTPSSTVDPIRGGAAARASARCRPSVRPYGRRGGGGARARPRLSGSRPANMGSGGADCARSASGRRALPAIVPRASHASDTHRQSF